MNWNKTERMANHSDELAGTLCLSLFDEKHPYLDNMSHKPWVLINHKRGEKRERERIWTCSITTTWWFPSPYQVTSESENEQNLSLSSQLWELSRKKYRHILEYFHRGISVFISVIWSMSGCMCTRYFHLFKKPDELERGLYTTYTKPQHWGLYV